MNATIIASDVWNSIAYDDISDDKLSSVNCQRRLAHVCAQIHVNNLNNVVGVARTLLVILAVQMCQILSNKQFMPRVWEMYWSSSRSLFRPVIVSFNLPDSSLDRLLYRTFEDEDCQPAHGTHACLLRVQLLTVATWFFISVSEEFMSGLGHFFCLPTRNRLKMAKYSVWKPTCFEKCQNKFISVCLSAVMLLNFVFIENSCGGIRFDFGRLFTRLTIMLVYFECYVGNTASLQVDWPVTRSVLDDSPDCFCDMQADISYKP